MPLKAMKQAGTLTYQASLEGEILQDHVASVAEDIDRSRVYFKQV